MSVALAWVPCHRCGTPCVSVPERWQLAQCYRCLPAPLVPRVGLTPWRPTIARVLPGELGPVVAHDGRTVKERESATALAAARSRYRVLVPARPAERSEMPKSLVDARKGIMGAPGWRLDRLTYAMAEDTERGELMHTVALVTVVGATLAVAFWEGGRWASGHIMAPYHRRCPTADEWYVRARGELWTPPSCPRCGRLGVKTRQDGATYKHKTTDGEECT